MDFLNHDANETSKGSLNSVQAIVKSMNAEKGLKRILKLTVEIVKKKMRHSVKERLFRSKLRHSSIVDFDR